MSGYYFLKVKKEYASAIIEDLQKLDAVELIETRQDEIPEKLKKEVLSRLEELNNNPDKAVDWKEAQKRIKALIK